MATPATSPIATVVVGTAGHIDHGKTTLLRALTGIDADRLPEERQRGMTIDVGFAHLDLDDGSAIDFVDVPGHDRLVGNMLVGAGEIDAVLLVVAADDGPRAQTLEHLELLDALGLRRAVVAITKVDVVEAPRLAEVEAATRALVDRTAMARAPVVAVSGVTGEGLPALRERLVELRDAVERDAARAPSPGPVRLSIDRAFSVKGRGAVVTGTLRGGSVAAGAELRLEPSDGRRTVRVREVQVHHARTDMAGGGRTSLNIGGHDAIEMRRGQVLSAGDGIVASERLVVALRRPTRLRAQGAVVGWPPGGRATLRLHLWTESVDAIVGPTGASWVPVGQSDSPPGSVAALVRLARPIAVMAGAHAVLRDPGSGVVLAGVTVLDPRPPRGVSRRRADPARLAALASTVEASGAAGDTVGGSLRDLEAALTDLHGWRDGRLAADVEEALATLAIARVGDGIGLADLRAALLRELRRLVTVPRTDAAATVVAIERVLARLVAEGRLARDGGRLLDPNRRAAVDDALGASMARLEAVLDVPVPPSLAEAARAAGCPPEGLRLLESSGRIVRVDDDLAWTSGHYAVLRDLAVDMARRGPLPPAAFRDAIGANRRVALALLEDLGRRGILRRTDAGHVLGPRAAPRPAP